MLGLNQFFFNGNEIGSIETLEDKGMNDSWVKWHRCNVKWKEQYLQWACSEKNGVQALH